MRYLTKLLLLLFSLTLIISSCESDAERKERKSKAKQEKIRLEAQRKQKAEKLAFQKEQERIEKAKREAFKQMEREAKLEKERKKKAIYDKYINNSLSTGSTPYSRYYGGNSTCNDYDCSELKVRTSNSDVIVTIKQNNKVVRHAYINAGSSYTFSIPNGNYQPFFYYGKGWNPNKNMKSGQMKGGFITNESFGKDDPQYLNNNVLTYKLILQQNGNFSTRPSNPEEAF